MKHKIVPVKNIARLASAYQALEKRPIGTPGMGLVYGHTGRGKTTAITWLINRCNGVYVRALSLWNATSMIRAIASELDIDVKGVRDVKLEQIIAKLAETQRPLFVDEADHIIGNEKITEALRDIYDLSGVPVVMVGMDRMRQKIAHYPQLENRIMEWIEFAPCDHEDAIAIAKGMCDVNVDSELLDELIHATGGEIRRLVVGLTQIENEAVAQDLSSIGKAQFNREFFLGRRPSAKGGH